MTRWIYALAVVILLVASLLLGAQIAFAETQSIIDPTETAEPAPLPPKASTDKPAASDESEAKRENQRAAGERKRASEEQRKRARATARAADEARQAAAAKEAAARTAAAREAATRQAAARDARRAAARAATTRAAAARATAARIAAQQQALEEAEAEAANQARREAARELAAREAAREKAAREAQAREAQAREAAAREAVAQEKAARERAARETAARQAAAREAASNQASAKLLHSRRSRENGLQARVGTVFRDCPDCPEMVWLPQGESVMGDGPRGPRNVATIDYPIAVGRFEVTFAEWDACVAARACRRLPRDSGWGRGRQPVIDVSWDDARQYTEWLSRRTGKTYRMLTEAEWEYAARAGTDARYWWGDQARAGVANCNDCGTQFDGRRPAPVGSFTPNPFGLHDMHGNVWEWVFDCTHDCPTLDAQIVRGGAWQAPARAMRSAARASVTQGFHDNRIGFRVARVE